MLKTHPNKTAICYPRKMFTILDVTYYVARLQLLSSKMLRYSETH